MSRVADFMLGFAIGAIIVAVILVVAVYGS